jgi:hypothetical protein
VEKFPEEFGRTGLLLVPQPTAISNEDSRNPRAIRGDFTMDDSFNAKKQCGDLLRILTLRLRQSCRASVKESKELKEGNYYFGQLYSTAGRA